MKNVVDIMVDIESAGTKVTAPLLSIGARVFDIKSCKLDEPFFLAIDPVSSFQAGIAEADTIQWWMKQTKEAQDNAWNNPAAVHISRALVQFAEFIKAKTRYHTVPVRLWGNAARFDMGILDYQYDKASMQMPWSFRFEMCYRTLKNSYKSWSMDKSKELNPDLWKQLKGGEELRHSALYDANIQALHAISIAHAFSIDSLINGDENNGTR
jgi:exodeoxyribonuclease VIII